jgi:hypothetical protein
LAVEGTGTTPSLVPDWVAGVNVPYFLSKAEAVVGGEVGAEVVAVVLDASLVVVTVEALVLDAGLVVVAVESPADDVLELEPQPATARHATPRPAPIRTQHGRLLIRPPPR